MQTQKRPHPSPSEARRARQAARISDDTFKGGGPLASRAGGIPRSPWLVGSGHLWEEARRRRQQDD